MIMPGTTSGGTAAQGASIGLDHIPGEDGWPIVGNTLSVLRDPLAAANAMYRRYGPVYRSRLFGYRSVALLGPEANELVLFDRDKTFASHGGWGPLLDRLFPRGLMLMDGEEHRLHRRALGVAFKPGAMKAHLGALNEQICKHFAGWHAAAGRPGGTAELLAYPAIKQLTLDLAATSFLGVGLGPKADAVNRAFVAMVAASVALIRAPLPGTRMRRGVRGRSAICAFFEKEIPRRRDGKGSDLFSELCRASGEDGALLTHQEIIDHMSFLMMAAHDTLTSSLTSLVFFLADNPAWQEELRREVLGLAIAPWQPLGFERLGELARLEMAFNEAMRINPPVPSIPRLAMRDFHFRGFHIPAGTGVSVDTLFTHHMPEIWPRPEKFDPLRFTEEAVRRRHKFAWVPYGGGAHMCLGLHFAYMQAKCFFYHLLATSRVSTRPGYVPRWQMWPIPKPRDGLPIRLERLC
jgi:cytochrome P450